MMIRRWLLLFALAAALPAQADERILSFDSDVTINSKGGLAVTETIRVRAEGRQIRRGIYREFPTRYRDRAGNWINVPLDVVSVTRDGEAEGWHTESLSNGVRVYFGRGDVFLDPGEYTYRFRYETDHQVGYFEDFDELYWNATGNDWAFPMDAASATIHLPQPVPPDDMQWAAYTGRQGDTGGDYRVADTSPGSVTFEATRTLGPGEGMTVAVGFPKGVVAEPTAAEKRLRFMRDNLGAMVGVSGLLAALAWYFVAWHRVGRDPESGAIYPRYEPPRDYSPASLRYVWRMGFDKACFAAGLVSLAVKGALGLEKNEDDDYVVSSRDESAKTDSKTEKQLFRNLFAGGGTLIFERGNHSRISGVIKAHENALNAAYEGRYFKRNGLWMLPGVLLSLLGLLFMMLLTPGEAKFVGLFMIVWLSFWTFAAGALAFGAWRSWRDLSGVVGAIKALFVTFFALPFVAAEIGVLIAFGFVVGLVPLLVLVGVLAANLLFYQLLKAPTLAGRTLLDEIEGLRLYLGVAERQDIESRHGDEPPRTIEEFEKLLPYAIALDSAETWAEKFEAEIAAAERAGELQNRSWYHAASDGGRGFSPGRLSSGLASGLSSAVASASTAPGSSSGSSGGGSSGGGGGGGGGGGW